MHYAILSSESKPGLSMPSALCPESASSPRIFDPEGLLKTRWALVKILQARMPWQIKFNYYLHKILN
jgi:hypothetical protein